MKKIMFIIVCLVIACTSKNKKQEVIQKVKLTGKILYQAYPDGEFKSDIGAEIYVLNKKFINKDSLKPLFSHSLNVSHYNKEMSINNLKMVKNELNQKEYKKIKNKTEEYYSKINEKAYYNFSEFTNNDSIIKLITNGFYEINLTTGVYFILIKSANHKLLNLMDSDGTIKFDSISITGNKDNYFDAKFERY
jgi:hypothetical protein